MMTHDLAGLRALLVNMPLRESAPPNCAPLGVALLAARLREHGATVSIVDLNAYRIPDRTAAARGLIAGRHLSYEEAEQLLWTHLGAHGAPHLVGISGKITTLRWQEWTVGILRRLLPDALLVSGGGLATEFRAGLFEWMPELDAVAHSEGDDVILKIGADALAIHRLGRTGAAASGCLAPALRETDGQRLRLVYAGDRPKDLDALPLPAWDLLETDVRGYPVLETYINNPIWGGSANNSSATPWTMSRSLNTVSSRGCPFSCVSGDTMIALPDRLFRPGDEPLGHAFACADGHSHRLGLTETRMVAQGERDCLRVVADNGLSVVLTPDHPVYCVEDERPIFKRADAVRAGDWLILEGGQNNVRGHAKLEAMSTLVDEPSHQMKPITTPKYLTENLAWLTGYLIGDGCLPSDGRPTVHFAVKPWLRDEIADKVRSVFGLELAIKAMANTKKCEHGWLYSKRARQVFEEGIGVSAADKLRVPKLIMASPAPVVRAFLNGLYAADGDRKCANEGLLTTFSAKLAEEVAALIFWVGDAAVLRGPYAAGADGRSQRFYVEWHGAACREREIGTPCGASRVPVPYRVYRSRKSGKWYKRTTESGRYGVTRVLLERVEAQHELLNRKWFYARVAAVEPAGRHQVFDVEAPEPHRFAANGIAVHNCNFCFRGAQGERNYSVRSARALAHEMEWLHRTYNVSFVASLDDNFMVRADRIEAMVATVGGVCQRTGLRWGAHGRLDEAADLRPGPKGPIPHSRLRVNDMAEAGCAYIGFGAESACPKTLTAMNKGGMMLSNGVERVGGYDLPKTMLAGYENTIKAGIHGNCTWIAGYPGETLHDMKHSLAFILWQRDLVGKVEAVNARMFTATCYPGTELARHPHVKKRLARGFNVRFNAQGEMVCDEALREYCLSLDDATKLLTDRRGESVYYGDMPARQFAHVRELLDSGRIDEVMAL